MCISHFLAGSHASTDTPVNWLGGRVQPARIALGSIRVGNWGIAGMEERTFVVDRMVGAAIGLACTRGQLHTWRQTDTLAVLLRFGAAVLPACLFFTDRTALPGLAIKFTAILRGTLTTAIRCCRTRRQLLQGVTDAATHLGIRVERGATATV